MPRFTAGELEVMRILWEHGEMKPAEIQAHFSPAHQKRRAAVLFDHPSRQGAPRPAAKGKRLFLSA